VAGIFDLTGKVAMVTGGNGGIGLGMALGLARAGARVVVVGRNRDKNTTAVATLSEAGPAALAVEADVTSNDGCRRLVEDVAARCGRIDILVNNAGTTVRKQPEAITETEWRHVIDTNLTSTFLCSQAVYPALLRAGGGKIVNIGSMMSVFGAPFAAAYGASKGGVVQLTRSLASAWAKDGIQVNAVLPGWIDTDMTVGARQQVAGLNERVLSRTPAGRWGMPSDLAGCAVFLCSAASNFVTGVALPVDGGYSIQS
jgi:2-dehydro-3-deoxy-D-gluconate 5-dehydrogenase